MSSKKDYYEILGVKKEASDADIKKAYRNLAREHHPDMAKASDKENAEKRFKEINEAYQVLKDPQKRKMYDQFGHAAGANGFNGAGGFSGNRGPFHYTYSSSGNPFGGGNADFDPFDIFEEFFGFRGFGGARKPKRGKNLHYELLISFKDSVFGIEKDINVESGKVKIRIPSGVRSGMEIKFPGKGMPGPDNLPAGDLFIIVRVETPKDFQVVGSDIVVVKEISFAQAALGGEIEVPIVDTDKKSGIGSLKLKIPTGTQYGQKFFVRGKGLPRVNSTGRGNLIVQVAVKIPKRLSRKQRKTLEDYQNLD